MTVSGKTITKTLDVLARLGKIKLVWKIMQELPELTHSIHKYLKPQTQKQAKELKSESIFSKLQDRKDSSNEGVDTKK